MLNNAVTNTTKAFLNRTKTSKTKKDIQPRAKGGKNQQTTEGRVKERISANQNKTCAAYWRTMGANVRPEQAERPVRGNKVGNPKAKTSKPSRLNGRQGKMQNNQTPKAFKKPTTS